MSMVTATTWVPRGRAARVPVKYEIDDDELARISQLAQMQLEDAQEDYRDAQDAAKAGKDGDGKGGENGADEDEDHDMHAAEDTTPAGSGKPEKKSKKKEKSKKKGAAASAKSQAELDDDLAEYNLSSYDTDSSAASGAVAGIPSLGNVGALVYHAAGEDDPYLTRQADVDEDGFSETSREALEIMPTDNLLIAARVQDEMAQLEVYVYEDEADNLYVHHDIMLESIPLCVEYIHGPKMAGSAMQDKSGGDGPGNYAAVGTFEPDIEIWDLDKVDCMFPHAILGEGGQPAAHEDGEATKKKKKKKKSQKTNDNYHTGPVLALAANPAHKTLLASASADTTVKLWDLAALKVAQSYAFHTDKACSVAWSPAAPTVLLSGSYDRTVVAAEMRAPGAQVPRWGVESDVETVRWDPRDANYFYVATEGGVLHCHDMRAAPAEPAASKPVWRLEAHSKPLSAFDINPHVPGLLATGSQDKSVKLWNLEGGRPSLVVSRNLDVGKVFSTAWAPDPEVGFRLAVAGSKGTVQIWDTSTNAGVRAAFAGKASMPDVKTTREDRLVGVADDSSDSDSDDEDDDEEHDEGWESMEEDDN